MATDSLNTDTISICSTISQLYLPTPIDKEYETKKYLKKIKKINKKVFKLRKEFDSTKCTHPHKITPSMSKNGERRKIIYRRFCHLCHFEFVIR
jgi:hypothetical protein